jgi:hypothetical protein
MFIAMNNMVTERQSTGEKRERGRDNVSMCVE